MRTGQVFHALLYRRVHVGSDSATPRDMGMGMERERNGDRTGVTRLGAGFRTWRVAVGDSPPADRLGVELQTQQDCQVVEVFDEFEGGVIGADEVGRRGFAVDVLGSLCQP